MPRNISFDVTTAELDLVAEIAGRARAVASGLRIPYTHQTIVMDLIATHANGRPLDFERLRDFPDGDFAHDVFGIRRHLNRETGELRDCFLPRCART